jgi:hypothetical protein
MKKIEDFLHLYIGCEYSTANSFGEVNATTLPMILKYLPDYKDFKLHLRRLSSMTEEEAIELYDFLYPSSTAERKIKRFAITNQPR